MINYNETGQGYFTFEEFMENDVIKEFANGFELERVKRIYLNKVYKTIFNFAFESDYSLCDITAIEWDCEIGTYKIIYGKGFFLYV